MAKATTRPTSTSPLDSTLSDRDQLARDIFVRLLASPGVHGKTAEHNAGRAFELADAFFAELKNR